MANKIKHYYKGVVFAVVIALAAVFLGKALPIIGPPVFGILLGIVIGNFIGRPDGAGKGLEFTSKTILKWAIIAIGAGLNINQIYEVGISSLYIMIFTLTSAFAAAYGLGKLMGIPFRLTTLIGMGTAICGGSAIAAISSIIDAEDQDIAYSISTVFLFNIVAVLVFPAVGHLIGFDDNAFGLWAGTAINDTSSVVAAGYSYSNSAGEYATIVKLTRTTMIIPITLIYAFVISVNKRREARKSYNVNYSFKKIFPWFILGFLGMSLANSLGILGKVAPSFLVETGKFLIIVALSAIGLNSDIKKMIKTGIKPVILGFTVWCAVSFVSIIVQYFTGQI